MKYYIWGIFFLFICFSIGFSNIEIKNWKYRKKISTDIKTHSDSLEAVYIDNEVFHNAKTDLSDLRIIREKDKEIAFKIISELEKTEKKEYNAKIINKSYIPGLKSQLELEIRAEIAEHNQIILDIENRNFTRWIEIEGSKDKKNWYKLQEKEFIFCYFLKEANETFIKNWINYPLTDYCYIRIIIHDEKEKALEIRSIKLEKIEKVPAVEMEVEAVIERKGENKENTAEIFILDMGGLNIPNHKLVISSKEDNFHRRVEILGSKNKEKWNFITNKDIYSYSAPKYKAESFEIEYSENKYRYLKVLIYHYDDSPLEVNDIEVFSIKRKIVFFHSGEGKKYLLYGNEKAHSPKYDISKYHKWFEKEKQIILSLGEEEINPYYKAPKYEWWKKNQRFILLVIMFFVVIFLGFFILRSIKELKQK
jgi:hypothetical protein